MARRAKKKITKIGVAVFVRNEKGEYLLSKKGSRGGIKRYWRLPGGAVKFKEHPKEACYREVAGEFGIKLKYLGLVGQGYNSHVYSNGEHHLVLFFRAYIIKGDEDKIKNNSEHRWFYPKEFPKKLLKPLPTIMAQLLITCNL